MSDKEKNYTVGHGKPPEASRFKPGQSGNPKGRPRGAKNLHTLLDKIINERVVVTENGKRKLISKLEAAVTQFVNKAATGDNKSIQPLLQFVQLSEIRKEAANGGDSSLGEVDQAVVQGLLNRLRRNVSPEKSRKRSRNSKRNN